MPSPSSDPPRSTARTSSPSGRATDAASADRQTWVELLRHLRRTQPDLCRQWFDNLDCIGFSSGVLQVRAATDVHRDYLQRSCGNAFADAARAVTGLLVSIRFLGPNDSVAAPPPPLPRAVSLTTTPASIVMQAAPVAAVGSGNDSLSRGQSVSHPATQNPGYNGSVNQPNQFNQSYQTHQGAPAHSNYGHTTRHDDGGHSANTPQRSTPAGGNQNSGGSGGSYANGGHSGHGNHGGHDESDNNSPTASAVMAELLGPGAGLANPGYRPVLDVYTDGLTINPDNSFENFVVGPETRFAHAAALAVSNGSGAQYNPLFLHAAVGLGKTHLLQAIVLATKARKPDSVIYYTSCDGFMTQFMDAVQAGMMAQFRNKFRHVDMLLVDDIHFLTGRGRLQEEFFHTFNALHQAGKQLVLSSDAAPDDIPDLEQRLVSRFNWGLVVKLDPPMFETREAIVKTKARLRGVHLPDEVASFIARRIESNIRELEGALTKLQVMADVERREIDMPLARMALSDGDSNRIEPKVQMRSIIELVTDYFGVTEPDLVSKRRHRSITQPRQVCMFLARHHTRFSLEEIGGHFGNRDHTTVMHAVKTIEDRCQTEEDFGKVVKQLEERLKSPRG